MAPSHSLTAVDTSEEKSTWPGESMRFSRYSSVPVRHKYTNTNYGLTHRTKQEFVVVAFRKQLPLGGFHSNGHEVLTVSVMQRDGTALHGDPPDLFVLSAVQIPQLTTPGNQSQSAPTRSVV